MATLDETELPSASEEFLDLLGFDLVLARKLLDDVFEPEEAGDLQLDMILPDLISGVEQSGIGERVVHERREAVVFVARPAKAAVGGRARALRVREPERRVKPVGLSRAAIQMEQAANDRLLCPSRVVHGEQPLEIAAMHDRTVDAAVR